MTYRDYYNKLLGNLEELQQEFIDAKNAFAELQDKHQGKKVISLRLKNANSELFNAKQKVSELLVVMVAQSKDFDDEFLPTMV